MRTTLIDRGRRYLDACMRQRERRMFHYNGKLHFRSQLPEDHIGEKYVKPIVEGAVLGAAIGRALKGQREEETLIPATVDRVKYSIPPPADEQ